MSDDKDRRELVRWLGILNVGWSAAGSILLGALLGYLMDRWLHTWPAFMIVLMLVGTVGGFYRAYRQIMRMTEDDGPD